MFERRRPDSQHKAIQGGLVFDREFRPALRQEQRITPDAEYRVCHARCGRGATAGPRWRHGEGSLSLPSIPSRGQGKLDV